jgi:hypothetical protein
MKLREIENKPFIRIVIGNAKKGSSNLIPPTKSISVDDISVEEMAKKIREMIKKEAKK